MPFRVLATGAIECDTLEEALAVQRASAGKCCENSVTAAEISDEQQAEDYDKFWADLEDKGKRFLKALANQNGGQIVTDELAAAIGVEPKSLQGTTIHVRKMGERYNIVPYKAKRKTVRGKFRSLYWMPRPVLASLRERLSAVPG